MAFLKNTMSWCIFIHKMLRNTHKTPVCCIIIFRIDSRFSKFNSRISKVMHREFLGFFDLDFFNFGNSHSRSILDFFDSRSITNLNIQKISYTTPISNFHSLKSNFHTLNLELVVKKIAISYLRGPI